MSRYFIDSNICIYALNKSDLAKSEQAIELLKQTPVISPQVLIETYNACSRKLKIATNICDQHTLLLTDLCEVFPINEDVIKTAIRFRNKYLFSFLDSCIVAAAFCSDCKILYSEDMQHNFVVEGILTILNPFA
jgi:predicted nucleic acid-binding protein